MQGPLPRTFCDTWQMVWELQVLVIVMTTRTVERHRTKCGQYWPELEGTSIEFGAYRIQSENIENYEDFIVTDLKITSILTGEERHVCHFQFTSWPDYGTPESAISKFEDIGKVDIMKTVECIRAQRAFSIQMPDQYVFCHLAFLEYVLNMGYVEEIDLTGFDEEELVE